MKRITDFIRSRIGFSLLSNVITVLVSFVVFRPFWEENDDVGMALFAEGAYGYREYHMFYSNTLYGRLVCLLQRVLPLVRWHAVLMLLFVFVAFTAFVFVIGKDRKGKMLSLILLVSTYYELYVSVQFSKTAVFIAIAAYVVIFELINTEMDKKTVKLLTAVSIVCLVFAIFIRIESFLLATLLAGCYGICLVVSQFRKGELGKKIRSYLGYFVSVFVVFIICFAIDRASYSDGWKEYMDFFYSVSGMVDYHSSSLLYDVHGEELKALGVSQNDALMYITYQSLEHSHTTNELMDRISALDKKGISSIDVDFIKAWVANIYSDVFSINGVVIGMIMLLGIVFANLLQNEDRLPITLGIIMHLVITVGILLFYQYSGRWCHRVVYTLFIPLLVLIVYLLRNMKECEMPRALIVGIFMLLAFSAIYMRLGNEFAYQEYKRSSFDHEQLISYMQQNKDDLFVTDVFTMLDYGKYDVFKSGRFGQFDNCLQTDSVLMANTPINRSIAERYGYADPLEALLSGDENVILVDAISPEVELTFCNEHGDGEYHLEELEPVGDVRLYRIRQK